MSSFIKRIKRKFYTYYACRRIKSYKSLPKVNGLSHLTENTILGFNVNFNGMKIIGSGEVVIGDNFHSGSECLILTNVHDYDHGNCIPYDSKKDIVKKVIIEDNVWLGTRVIILGGVTLGEGSIIQAGAVVVNDVPKYGIAGGNRAKVFKYRDIEHYEKLKIDGRFH